MMRNPVKQERKTTTTKNYYPFIEGNFLPGTGLGFFQDGVHI
jgi:hypothetical protein